MGRTRTRGVPVREAYDQLGALTGDRWKQEAREVKLGAANDGDTPDYSNLGPLRKRFVLDGVEHVGKQEGSETDRVLRFTISTDSVDRDGDTIAVDGWELDNFLKNPVVLFGHNYRDLPVARALDVWVEGKKLKSDAEFTDAETYAFGDTVYRMFLGKYMRAVSVGFSPTKWMWVEEDDRPFGIDFIQQELLEYSAVPVPANPEALEEAKSAGINLAPLKDYMDELEASWNEVEGGVMVPRRLVQQMAKVLHGDQRTVTFGDGVGGSAAKDGLYSGHTYDREGEPVEEESQEGGGQPADTASTSEAASGGEDDRQRDNNTIELHQATNTMRFTRLLVEVRCRALQLASGDEELKEVKAEQIRREANFLAAKLLPDVRSEDFERLFPELCGDGEFGSGKSGRVLSAANRSKLRESRDGIQEVLDADQDESDDGEGDDGSESSEGGGNQEESAEDMQRRMLEWAQENPDEVRSMIQRTIREGVGLHASER